MNLSFGGQQQQQQPFQSNPFQQQPQQSGMFQQQQPFQQSFFGQPQTMEQQRQHQMGLNNNEMKQVLEKLYTLQNQPQFQALIQKLLEQQKTASNFISKVIQSDEIKPLEASKMQQITLRTQKIKQKNAIIMAKLLAVKAKLQRFMYKDQNVNSRYELQTSQTMEKIRFLKSEITQKCTYLKTLRVNQAEQNGEEKKYKPKVKTISGVGVALTELKRGTEVLKREVTKKKTEMDLIDKYLNEK